MRGDLDIEPRLQFRVDTPFFGRPGVQIVDVALVSAGFDGLVVQQGRRCGLLMHRVRQRGDAQRVQLLSFGSGALEALLQWRGGQWRGVEASSLRISGTRGLGWRGDGSARRAGRRGEDRSVVLIVFLVILVELVVLDVVG